MTKLIRDFITGFETLLESLNVDLLNRSAALLLDTQAQKGHIYVSGVGKSRFIAERLASVMRTIKLEASFVHPTEAMHGELGCMREEDLLIFVSASGASAELVALADHPVVRSMNTMLISASHNPPLGTSTTVSLTPTCKTPDLAFFPAVSSAILMCLGDSVCQLVAVSKDISSREIAVGHPNGTFFDWIDT